jgi:hypothetical protein
MLVDPTPMNEARPVTKARVVSLERILDPRSETSRLVVRFRTETAVTVMVMTPERARELGLFVAYHHGTLVPIPKP